MNIKSGMKVLFTNCIFLVGLIVIVGGLSDLFRTKGTQRINGTFFNQPKDYDVLFFGTSHVRYGIYPMELWEEYGITSYNLAIRVPKLPDPTG